MCELHFEIVIHYIYIIFMLLADTFFFQRDLQVIDFLSVSVFKKIDQDGILQYFYNNLCLVFS